MNQTFILDSNIMIYLAQDRKETWESLSDLSQDKFWVSTVTRMECLLGTNKEENERILFFLSECNHIPFTAQIADEAAKLYHSHKSLKFKDSIIASTALVHKKTLITSDKGFQKIKGIKVKLVTPN